MSVEAALIGSLVIDPEAVATVVGIVRAEHFVVEPLGAIYRCIERMHGRGSPVDYVTLCEEIEWSGALKKWGRTPDMRSSVVTATINHAPTSLHAVQYAELVARAGEIRLAEGARQGRHPAAID